jgi:hypothetical protein
VEERSRSLRMRPIRVTDQILAGRLLGAPGVARVSRPLTPLGAWGASVSAALDQRGARVALERGELKLVGDRGSFHGPRHGHAIRRALGSGRKSSGRGPRRHAAKLNVREIRPFGQREAQVDAADYLGHSLWPANTPSKLLGRTYPNVPTTVCPGRVAADPAPIRNRRTRSDRHRVG